MKNTLISISLISVVLCASIHRLSAEEKEWLDLLKRLSVEFNHSKMEWTMRQVFPPSPGLAASIKESDEREIEAITDPVRREEFRKAFEKGWGDLENGSTESVRIFVDYFDESKYYIKREFGSISITEYFADGDGLRYAKKGRDVEISKDTGEILGHLGGFLSFTIREALGRVTSVVLRGEDAERLTLFGEGGGYGLKAVVRKRDLLVESLEYGYLSGVADGGNGKVLVRAKVTSFDKKLGKEFPSKIEVSRYTVDGRLMHEEFWDLVSLDLNVKDELMHDTSFVLKPGMVVKDKTGSVTRSYRSEEVLPK